MQSSCILNVNDLRILSDAQNTSTVQLIVIDEPKRMD